MLSRRFVVQKSVFFIHPFWLTFSVALLTIMLVSFVFRSSSFSMLCAVMCARFEGEYWKCKRARTCRSYFLSVLGVSAFGEVRETFVSPLYPFISSYVYSTLLENPKVHRSVVFAFSPNNIVSVLVFVFSPSRSFPLFFIFYHNKTWRTTEFELNGEPRCESWSKLNGP